MDTNRQSARRSTTAVLAIGVVLVAVLAGCGVPGDDGAVYLAIDWSSAPQALYFPAFPQTIYAGEYVEHESGSYAGEYVAWDGTYWVADYWIEVDPGGEAPLFGTGEHGDDHYLSMWLYSFGPSIYTDDVVSRSVGPEDAEETSYIVNETQDVPVEIAAAREGAVAGESCGKGGVTRERATREASTRGRAPPRRG